MTSNKTAKPAVKSFATHAVITPPNPLRQHLRPAQSGDDDPVARAEQALNALSGQFGNWMVDEAAHLASAHAAFVTAGGSDDGEACDEMFRAAHDIKGSAATFGYPQAAEIADSLCQIIENTVDPADLPATLVAHHVQAIHAVVRESNGAFAEKTAGELCRSLRKLSDAYLASIGASDAVEAVSAPPLVPR